MTAPVDTVDAEIEQMRRRIAEMEVQAQAKAPAAAAASGAPVTTGTAANGNSSSSSSSSGSVSSGSSSTAVPKTIVSAGAAAAPNPLTPEQKHYLVAQALVGQSRAYCPYSHYPVGAAILAALPTAAAAAAVPVAVKSQGVASGSGDGKAAASASASASVLAANEVVFVGCNIENAAYGFANCAERTAIFKAISEGVSGRQWRAMAVVTADGGLCCGACRQVAFEFAPDLVVVVANGKGQITRECTITELLPHAFGPSNLK